MVINMNNYEGYFNYKTNRNEFNFSFEEYVVWNLYNGKFQKPYSVQKKADSSVHLIICILNIQKKMHLN